MSTAAKTARFQHHQKQNARQTLKSVVEKRVLLLLRVEVEKCGLKEVKQVLPKLHMD